MAPDIPKIDPNQRGQTGRYTSFPRWKIGSIPKDLLSSHFSVTCRTVGISAELTYNPGGLNGSTQHSAQTHIH